MLQWRTTKSNRRAVYGPLREIKAGYEVEVEGIRVLIVSLGKPHRVNGKLWVYGYVD